MRILVTRPEPDSLRLKGLLEAAGHVALAAPLLSLRPIGLPADALEGVTGLIATSRNGLRALIGTEALEQARPLTVFAVGRATAEEARRMGFARIVKGPGTAAGLLPLIASLIDPAEEVLLHLAGEQLAFDLSAELGHLGIRVTSEIVYRMEAARELPAAIATAITMGEVEAVMLMSPQTAIIWGRLIARHKLASSARGLLHLCISETVAAHVEALGAAEIVVAAEPTLEAMLETVDRASGHPGVE